MLDLTEFHKVTLCQTLQPFQVMLDGITALCYVRQLSQFCVISKLPEGTLYAFIQVVDEYIEQDCTQN